MLSSLMYRLRNGLMGYHISVSFEEARFCVKFLNVLWDEGLIRGYKKMDNGIIFIFLLYCGGYSQIQRLSIISKPSSPLYISCLDLARLNRFSGVLILSTPKGIMTGQKALRIGQGGQVLAYFE
uniref:Ribosomal protein S8 n=1 Tax=Protohalopteris sp. TaxID=2843287 RepID=A0A8F0FDJ8_9PHAE|nr:ribosomal protein S8 [Protohalopteris sp.]